MRLERLRSSAQSGLVPSLKPRVSLIIMQGAKPTQIAQSDTVKVQTGF
jgi:hypothetical protein